MSARPGQEIKAQGIAQAVGLTIKAIARPVAGDDPGVRPVWTLKIDSTFFENVGKTQTERSWLPSLPGPLIFFVGSLNRAPHYNYG